MDYLHKKKKEPPTGRPKFLAQVTGEMWELIRYLRERIKYNAHLEIADVDEICFRMNRLETRISAYGDHRYEEGKREQGLFGG